MKVDAKEINSQIDAQKPSRFTGGMLANYFIGLFTVIVSAITLGLAYPAMICWKLRWKASHTYLNGRQLVFDGRGTQLLGKYILWAFLSIITFGLYYIFSAKLKMTEWETKHTHFANYNYDKNDNKSKFSGKWYQLFGVNFICNFVTVITFTIGYYWAHCYKERWYCKHKTIDGCQLEFNGTGMQYFGKRAIWTLLSVITCGIYTFWLQIKSVKWTVYHTNLLNMPIEYNFMSVENIEALPQTSKSNGHNLCLIGFFINLVAFIGCLIFHLTLLEVLGVKHASTINITLTILISILAFVGNFICQIGRNKISSVDTESVRLSVTGIVLGAITLVAFLISVMGEILQ